MYSIELQMSKAAGIWEYSSNNAEYNLQGAAFMFLEMSTFLW